MIKEINKNYHEEAITIDEVRMVLYGMDLNNIDYCNVPLGKLTHDILKGKNI